MKGKDRFPIFGFGFTAARGSSLFSTSFPFVFIVAKSIEFATARSSTQTSLANNCLSVSKIPHDQLSHESYVREVDHV